jgi:hypothetical protein
MSLLESDDSERTYQNAKIVETLKDVWQTNDDNLRKLPPFYAYMKAMGEISDDSNALSVFKVCLPWL